jgi:TolB-like protein
MATTYGFGAFRLDAEANILFHGAEVTPLGGRAVAVLRVLVQQAGAVVGKTALIDAAWSGLAVEESNLPVQIAAVRRVLAAEVGGERWIETLPRRGYRFVGPAVVEVRQGAEPRPTDPPSIAVLPFSNLSDRPERQRFGDAIANDIITVLTRFRWFRVVARDSSFAYRNSAVDVRQIASALGVRYVLAGSYSQMDARIRITAQLIDATSGNHLWAERYERDLNDVFAIQDEITDHVVGAIEPELLRTESQSSAVRNPDRETAPESDPARSLVLPPRDAADACAGTRPVPIGGQGRAGNG